MTGPLEIAFDLIESAYPFGENSQIVGVYEATIYAKNSEMMISSLA